jgi:hypothetical protein
MFSQQIRQSPVFLGRKKRSDDMVDALNEENVAKEKIIENENNNKISEQVNQLKQSAADVDDNDEQIVYKFNPDEHFIVAKEVEALIIDLPEIMDEAVFAAA